MSKKGIVMDKYKFEMLDRRADGKTAYIIYERTSVLPEGYIHLGVGIGRDEKEALEDCLQQAEGQ
ncbi:MAG: hypothetical protein ACLFR9_02085 [Desulfobacterales bacterium]